MREIKFFDTTLRDGEQGIGYTMTEAQKLEALPMLDTLGVDVLEIGMVADEASERFFESAARLAPRSRIAALCRLKTDDVIRTVTALERFPRSAINLLTVGSEIHLRDKLDISAATLANWTTTMLQCIHSRNYQGRVCAILEDASRGSDEWIDGQVRLLQQHGVRHICIADTVGCMVPGQVLRVFQRLIATHPGVAFSAHFHNDLGLATANSLAAIEAGVDEIQLTLAGIGERCGNAAMEEIVAALQMNPMLARLATPQVGLREAVAACDALHALYGYTPNEKKPILGEHAYTTCAGIHQAAIMKAPHIYEMFDPALIGRERRFHINRLSSRKCRDTSAPELPVSLDRDQSVEKMAA